MQLSDTGRQLLLPASRRRLTKEGRPHLSPRRAQEMSEPQGSGTPASRHLDIVRPCHENALEALQVFNQLPNVCVGHQQAQATSGSDRGGVLSARTTVNVQRAGEGFPVLQPGVSCLYGDRLTRAL